MMRNRSLRTVPVPWILRDPILPSISSGALPGFATNEQVKAAYSMTFGALAPMLGLPTEAIEDLLRELNAL